MRCLLYALLSLWVGCADRATVGALCPVGCEPRPEDSICDCAEQRAAGRPDSGPSAAPDAAGAQPAEADGGSQPCLPGQAPNDPVRLDLMVVFDDGASLAPWYPQMYEGFRAFIREDASRGVGIGLQRFGESCNALDYSPPMVQIAALPDNLAALEEALPTTALSTNSTLPALDAAEQYAQRWAADHPEAHVAVLLLTDASPGACDALTGNYDVEAARLAGAAQKSSPSIDTYVVAAGSLEIVDSIARSGGTQLQRLPITLTSDDVLAALRNVREAARSRPVETTSSDPCAAP